MKKRIVFKLKVFPTASETFVVNNIVCAIEAGYEIAIIADKINPEGYSSQPEILRKFQLLSKVSVEKDEKITGIDFFNPVLIWYFLKYCLLKRRVSLAYLRTLKFYKKYRKDCFIHVHFGTAIQPLYYLDLLGFMKSNIAVTFHGYDAYFLSESTTNKAIIDFYNKRVRSITVNSLYLKEILVSKGIIPKNIKIIPIGMDATFFTPKLILPELEPFQLITIGRLIPLKGQLYGMKALKVLLDKGYDVNYMVVGGGLDLEVLKKESEALQIRDKVQFLGIKTQSEIKELLGKSALFLMTSTKDKTGRCEAFGLVSLEAQAMGVPVIGFDAGGFPETILEGKTGYLVADKDFVAMAEKVETLITNNSLLKQMVQASRSHVIERFSRSKTTAKYLDLYKE